MRKLTAILLLSLFAFNLVGYRLLYTYVKHQSDTQFTVALDKQHYNDEELVAITVPLSMPYLGDWNEFERVDGEINWKGKTYKYVKRKVSNGQLTVLCIPDKKKDGLKSAEANFFRDVNDLSQSNSAKEPGSKSFSIKNPLTEYIRFSIDFTASSFEQTITLNYSQAIPSLLTKHSISPEHPPQQA